MTSPILYLISSAPLEAREQYLQWNETNERSPTKRDTTAIEERQVQPVCSALDFVEHLAIVLGNAERKRLLDPLCLGAWFTIEASSRNLFEIRILSSVVSKRSMAFEWDDLPLNRRSSRRVPSGFACRQCLR